MVCAFVKELVGDKVPVDDGLCDCVPLLVGVTDGVPERDSAAVCVGLCVVETEEDVVGELEGVPGAVEEGV